MKYICVELRDLFSMNKELELLENENKIIIIGREFVNGCIEVYAYFKVEEIDGNNIESLLCTSTKCNYKIYYSQLAIQEFEILKLTQKTHT